ncbi:hypothetical protein L9F63_014209, partial [Diploptera punctata]
AYGLSRKKIDFYFILTDGPVDFSSRPTSSSSQMSSKLTMGGNSESEEDEIDIVGEHHGPSVTQTMLILRENSAEIVCLHFYKYCATEGVRQIHHDHSNQIIHSNQSASL